MWRILKTEILYNHSVISYIVLTSFFSFIILHFWPVLTDQTPANPNIGLVSLTHLPFFLLGTILISLSNKENRIRHHALLPIEMKKIGMVRSLLFFIYWSIFLILFFIYTGISRYFFLNRVTFLALSVQTGVVFIILSIIIYWRDLLGVIHNRKFPLKLTERKIAGFFTMLIILLLGFIALAGIIHTYQGRGTSGINSLLTLLYQSETAALLFPVTGLIFSGLSILTFNWRKTYIQN